VSVSYVDTLLLRLNVFDSYG